RGAPPWWARARCARPARASPPPTPAWRADRGGSASPRPRRLRREGLRLGREAADLHLRHVLARGAQHLAAELRVALGEAGRPVGREAEEVVQDEYLAVAAHARADPDGRDGELGRDLAGEVERDALEHDGEGARRLDGARVVQDALALARAVSGATALHAVAAHTVDGLRGQPDVSHHRHVDRGDRLDGAGHRDPALELDRPGPALLHEAHRALDRLLGARLVGAERKIAQDEGAL